MGEQALFEWRVQNAGNFAINGQWQDSLYLSSDPVWDLADIKIGTFTSTTSLSGPLEPGETLLSSAQAVVPGVVPGEYFVLLRTDVFNNVPETNEANNCCGISTVGILEFYGSDFEDARKALTDCYCGCYSSLADYAQDLTEETFEVPDHLAAYIDYERMGRDMDLSGDILKIEIAHDEVHVFWPR